jgi:hypothetical protein
MKPLLITDCDEVLLHMVQHFSTWLDEAHDVRFAMAGQDFEGALTRRDCGTPLASAEIWPLLDGFFASEMHRQTLVPGAGEALMRLGDQAEIVVLTNLVDECHAGRVAQLEAHGIRHRVVCNQGGKGPAVRRLLEEFAPEVAVFVDDLAVHHASVAHHAPSVWRLHLIAEPAVAVHVPAAPAAHERIDDWPAAERWIAGRFAAGRQAHG